MSDIIWTLKADTGDNGDGLVEEQLRVWATALARACSGDLIVAQRDNGSWDICAYATTGGRNRRLDRPQLLSRLTVRRKAIAHYAGQLHADRYPLSSFTGCVLAALDAREEDCLPGRWAAPRLGTVDGIPAVLVPLDGGYTDESEALYQLPLPQYKWAIIHAEALS